MAKFVVTYSDLEKLKYYLKQNDIDLVKTEFSENVEVYVDLWETVFSIFVFAGDKKVNLISYLGQDDGYHGVGFILTRLKNRGLLSPCFNISLIM